MEDDNNNEEKDFEIVSGDGELEISPVYSHLNINKTNENNENKKNIIIPIENK